MIERHVDIGTKDGRMKTFICHPERSGPHPMIIFLMDAPGIREELRDMARRLGTVGYYVMLPNLYYRFNVDELGPYMGEAHSAIREKFMKLKDTLTMDMVMEDVGELIVHAGKDAAASTGAIGCVGYCMSGRYAINTAVCHGNQVRAAASIYGTELVSGQPDSPHLAAQRTHARLYFACAETDPYAPIETIDRLRRELSDKEATTEVEIYPGTQHGFAFAQRPAYIKWAAERHWERLFTLFREELMDRTVRANTKAQTQL